MPFVAFSQPQIDSGFVVKKSKLQLRYIHPKSKYIAVSRGWGYTSTYINDANSFFNQGYARGNNTNVTSIVYEHGLRDNFFIEAGYANFEMGIMIERIIDDIGWSSYKGLYRNYELQLGAGYRIVARRNYHILNLHSGIFVGVAGNKIGEFNDSGTYTDFDYITGSVFSYRLVNNYSNPISFGPYLGVSKEIRLSRDVRFFVKYIQRFGLLTNLSGDIELNSPTLSLDKKASYAMRSGGNFITAGLKILLFKNKLKKYDE